MVLGIRSYGRRSRVPINRNSESGRSFRIRVSRISRNQDLDRIGCDADPAIDANHSGRALGWLLAAWQDTDYAGAGGLVVVRAG